jgi:hypothetical protein
MIPNIPLIPQPPKDDDNDQSSNNNFRPNFQ